VCVFFFKLVSISGPYLYKSSAKIPVGWTNKDLIWRAITSKLRIRGKTPQILLEKHPKLLNWPTVFQIKTYRLGGAIQYVQKTHHSLRRV
jgi:hypothetical protein